MLFLSLSLTEINFLYFYIFLLLPATGRVRNNKGKGRIWRFKGRKWSKKGDWYHSQNKDFISLEYWILETAFKNIFYLQSQTDLIKQKEIIKTSLQPSPYNLYLVRIANESTRAGISRPPLVSIPDDRQCEQGRENQSTGHRKQGAECEGWLSVCTQLRTYGGLCTKEWCDELSILERQPAVTS